MPDYKKYLDLPKEELEEKIGEAEARLVYLRGKPLTRAAPYVSLLEEKHTGERFSEVFIRDIEKAESGWGEDSVEQVLQKYVRKLLARGGYKKEEAEKKLIRILKKHKEDYGGF